MWPKGARLGEKGGLRMAPTANDSTRLLLTFTHSLHQLVGLVLVVS